MPIITKRQFVIMAKGRLDGSLRRSLRQINRYGVNWAGDILLNLLYAVDQGKVEEVLDRFEAHYEAYGHRLDTSATQEMFDYVRERVLNLPTARPFSTMHPLKPEKSE
ncbi:MAG: hypothetical protein Q7J73_00840 [Dehalococcoidales bacterium]|nr:hypothetical protein [Dehalococcoidales bacterium]